MTSSLLRPGVRRVSAPTPDSAGLPRSRRGAAPPGGRGGPEAATLRRAWGVQRGSRGRGAQKQGLLLWPHSGCHRKPRKPARGWTRGAAGALRPRGSADPGAAPRGRARQGAARALGRSDSGRHFLARETRTPGSPESPPRASTVLGGRRARPRLRLPRLRSADPRRAPPRSAWSPATVAPLGTNY